MPGIEIRTRGQVFDKRSRVKQAGNLLLDCKLPPGMLACHRLEVWSCEYLTQVPETVHQVIPCGDERHVVPYRHAVSLRLTLPLLRFYCRQDEKARRWNALLSGGLL